MICSLCRTSQLGPTVDAGGDLGLVHDDCFEEWDRRAEAVEAMVFTAPVYAPDPVDQPRARRYRGTEDLTGRRFGQLEVLSETARLNGRVLMRAWLCRCDCGRHTTIETYRLTRRNVKWCKACGSARAARVRRGPFRSRVVEGQLVAEIAREAGVAPSTIWTRIQRGWTGEKLRVPSLRPRTIGNARRAA